MVPNLEERMDARQIVGQTRMSARPEFYSGRGAITCDLNDRILEQVYAGVQREHGKEAAQHYAQMVADIPVLSATDFLLSLYRLEGNDWKWDKKLLGREKGVYVDGKTDQEKMAISLATIGGALGTIRDETTSIRMEFLRRHNIKHSEQANKIPTTFGIY